MLSKLIFTGGAVMCGSCCGAVICGSGGGAVICGNDWGTPGNIIFLLSDDIAYWGHSIYETSPVGIYDGNVGIFNKSVLTFRLYFRFFFGFVGGGVKSFNNNWYTFWRMNTYIFIFSHIIIYWYR